MRRRSESETSSSSEQLGNQSGTDDRRGVEEEDSRLLLHMKRPQRSPLVCLTLFVAIIYGSWTVYRYQFESLPLPLTAEQAGKRGFSEVEALKHVKALTELGPHSVGSDALHLALQVWPL